MSPDAAAMAEPIGLAQVEAKILEIIALLEKATLLQKARWEEDAEADSAYDLAYARAYLLAKEGQLPGQENQEKPDSDQTAKMRATVVCEVELTRHNGAKAVLESAREAARNYRAALEGLRSINANVRELTT